MTHQTSVSGTNNLKLIDLLGIKYIDKCRGKRKVKNIQRGRWDLLLENKRGRLVRKGGLGGGDGRFINK